MRPPTIHPIKVSTRKELANRIKWISGRRKEGNLLIGNRKANKKGTFSVKIGRKNRLERRLRSSSSTSWAREWREIPRNVVQEGGGDAMVTFVVI